jgi:outer membrane lipoprotein SlyB
MRKEVLLVALFMAAFCAFSIGRIQAQSPTVDYAVVTKVNPVELGEGGNNLGTAVGALLGGAAGYAIGKGSSSGKKRRGILAGGAAGGLIGNRATKGTNKGYEYTVKLMAGNSISITTEQGRIDVGDCVTVERGESANIRRASEVHCQAKDTRPSAEHVVEARECEAAKAAMLDAETTEVLEAAVDKARVLCEE